MPLIGGDAVVHSSQIDWLVPSDPDIIFFLPLSNGTHKRGDRTRDNSICIEFASPSTAIDPPTGNENAPLPEDIVRLILRGVDDKTLAQLATQSKDFQIMSREELLRRVQIVSGKYAANPKTQLLRTLQEILRAGRFESVKLDSLEPTARLFRSVLELSGSELQPMTNWQRARLVIDALNYGWDIRKFADMFKLSDSEIQQILDDYQGSLREFRSIVLNPKGWDADSAVVPE